MARNCLKILPPYCSFHCQILFTSSSLPRSWRVLPSFSKMFFSTTAWVAMPAWSVPGCQSVLQPSIL